MPTKDKEFNIKLKKCKSLEDYRNLAEEYNIDKNQFTAEYRERIVRKAMRSKKNLSKFF